MRRPIKTWALIGFLVACGGCTGGPDEPTPSQSSDATPSLDVSVEDTGLGEVVEPTGPPCTSDADCDGVFFKLEPCQRAQCGAQQSNGQAYCEVAPRAFGLPCDDGDPCTQSATCEATGCVRASTRQCADPGPCAESLGCESGCEVAPRTDGTPCNDGNLCTVGDVCAAGLCQGAPDTNNGDCSCAVDSDCPTLLPCDGEIACQGGQCVRVPDDGVVCPATPEGACWTLACAEGICVADARPDEVSCDDGNPCTADDRCLGGACVGSANQCQCAVDADCQAFEDADLCNGTLVCEADRCVVNPASVVRCEPLMGSPCHERRCLPTTGLCKVVALADGVTCSDGSACTLGDHCEAGECVSAVQATCGMPKSCAGVACAPACWALFQCQPETGCVEQTLDGVACSDGNPCDLEDFCDAGACHPGLAQTVCDDHNPCTSDQCDPSLPSGCAFVPDPEAGCDDGDPCTEGDHCLEGQCLPTSEVNCDDGNVCTTGVCVPGSGCEFFNNGQPCEDGDPCTEADKCQQGKCKPGAKVCPCNEDANCSGVGAGTCAGVWHCIANQCVLDTNVATSCGGLSDTPCSVSVCDAQTGTCLTELAPNGHPCVVNDPCVVDATCLAGTCVGQAAVDLCDDGEGCTADACVSGQGCVHANTEGPCDDGDPCTAPDLCQAGGCVGGAKSCECLADTDCTQPADKCEAIVRCVDHVCVPSAVAESPCLGGAAGPCVEAGCDPASGLCVTILLPDEAPCQDGDLCIAGKACLGGDCLGGVPVDCDDQNPCTDDLCEPGVGCQHLANAAPCNDGDPCTADEACMGGACVATGSVCPELCHNGLDDDGDGMTDCQDPACEPVGACDACATAPFIQCGSAGVPGAVGDLAQSQVGPSGCGGGELADRVYRFTTSTSGPVAVTLLQGAGAFTVHILTAAADGGCDAQACKAVGSEAGFDAVAGQIYHVVVEKLFLGGLPNFVLSVTCSQPCSPSCDGVECGPDGCGGTCGTCEDQDVCTVDFCDSAICGHAPIAGCCTTAADCDDGVACTLDVCEGNACETIDLVGCCDTATDCDDGVPCTVDACVDANCVVEVPEGCCTVDSDCADTNPCTIDQCIAGACSHLAQPGCCTQVADCDQGAACQVVGCIANLCTVQPIVGCCESAEACADGDPCTYDACDVGGLSCVHAAVAGCCHVDADCPQADEPCLTSICAGGTCTKAPLEGCCQTAADCPSPAGCALAVCEGAQCVEQSVAGCCEADSDCDDQDPCTVDRCAGAPGARSCVNAAKVGCCTEDSQCNDGDACTADLCIDGLCAAVTLELCCVTDGECDDGERCTDDSCVAGACTHSPVPACCNNAFDCQVGPCLLPTCGVDGFCAYDVVPGCCESPQDCYTNNPCVSGGCVSGVCVFSQKPDCCLSDNVCSSTDPCSPRVCQNNKCVAEPVPGCCADDSECASKDPGCGVASCLGHTCVAVLEEGCCAVDADCQGSACEAAYCQDGSCTSAPVAGCCETAADCPVSLEPCISVACMAQKCVAAPDPGCCTTAADCEQAGAGACVTVDCVLGACASAGTVPGCCESVSDCPDPSAPCQVSACLSNTCVVTTLPGCCETAADCPAPSTDCQAVDCQNGTCEVVEVEGCCFSAADCPAAGNPCTEVDCLLGGCVGTPSAGCCQADSDCPKDVNPCLRQACVQGACEPVAIEGCCVTAGDCPEAPACLKAVCVGERCLEVPLPGCCAGDGDCPEDPGLCVQARCKTPLGEDLGTCAWETLEGCCATATDCSAPADPCVEATCEGGACRVSAIAACAVGACTYQGFDTGLGALTLSADSPGLEWVLATVDGATVLAAEFGSLGVISGADVQLPWVAVTGAARLRFSYRLAVAYGDCSAGRLSALVETSAGGPSVTVWSDCHPGGWRDAIVELGAYAGQQIRVRLRIESGKADVAGGAWLDDVALSGACAQVCDTGCEDGDPCTADACVSGQCVSSPILGCCTLPAACADSDPCTVDGCEAGAGCSHSPTPGCALGACLASDFDQGEAPGWNLGTTEGAVTAGAETQGSFSVGGNLVMASQGEGNAELELPRVIVSSPLTLRFVLKQSVGLDCELAQVSVVNGDQVIPIPCGNHDWRLFEVPLAGEPGTWLALRLRFEAAFGGAKASVDDVRLSGGCTVVGCQTAADCDDNDLCTADGCGAGFQCVHVAVPGCCQDDTDCAAQAPCQTVACVANACVSNPVVGCVEGACWEAGGEAAALGLSQGATGKAVWSLGGGGATPWELIGGTNSGGDAGTESAPEMATVDLPPILVGGGGVTLRMRMIRDFPIELCADGALEIWVGGQLSAVFCDSQPEWEELSLPLPVLPGQVARVQLRIRSAASAGVVGEVHLRDVRLDGECAPVECSHPEDCDDQSACTEDACSGFACVHLTVAGPCDDGNACTVGESCLDGACVAPPGDGCDDHNPCTDDLCDPQSGCLLVENTQPCDDGDPCTAGDSCGDGVCAGTPLQCKDFNPCTVDGCTAGVGCAFIPEPFGAPCGVQGESACWSGECVAWEIALSEVPPATATRTEARAILGRTGPTPLKVAGTHDPDGTPRAAVFRIDHNTLSLELLTETAGVGAWSGISAALVVGDDGGVLAVGSEVSAPAVDVASGLDLHAVIGVGATSFVGGDGSAALSTHSTVRRCQQTVSGWAACSVMPVVRSAAHCGKQLTFHTRRLWAPTSQLLLVAGASVEAGDFTARIAVWDGNTLSDCEPLGVYSGEIYYDDPGVARTLAVNEAGAGVEESFLALDGTSATDIWAGGTRGGLYHYGADTGWLKMAPSPEVGWSTAHTVRGIVASQSEVHVVGDGVGVASGGCRDAFYVHGRRYGDTWVLDRRVVFGGALRDCGAAPFGHVGLADVSVDGLTNDLYMVGWAPDLPSTPTERRGLVIRLRSP